VRGWEADLTWQPTEGFHLTAAVNWVDSEIQSDPPLPIDPYGNLTTFVGERFPYTPEWQATTGRRVRVLRWHDAMVAGREHQLPIRQLLELR
jgi:outer membrane receptor protein involved in Fe transport